MSESRRIGILEVDAKLLAVLLQLPWNARIVGPDTIKLTIENPDFKEVQPNQPIPQYSVEKTFRWVWTEVSNGEIAATAENTPAQKGKVTG